jgi:multidrug efflux pump subunit AcrA (membrane-fusion protein)
MNELVTAFQNLIRDLNFKLGSEKEEYRWAAAEHHELDKEINERLRDAKVRFGVASAHLQNTLYPERARLEALIAADEALIARTEAEMATATHERQVAQSTYERNCEEHDLTMDAVHECTDLLNGLMNGGASFVEVTKAQKNLKKVIKKLSVSSKWGHIAKVLVEMSQDFASGEAVQNVLNLFNDLQLNLIESREEMDRVNVQQIATYEHFMTLSQETIDQAQARIDANQADLDVVNAEIAHQEELRDTAAEDRDVAQADLDEETARWAGVQASYEAYVAELMHELDALAQCIGVFSSFEMSDEMLARVDW